MNIVPYLVAGLFFDLLVQLLVLWACSRIAWNRHSFCPCFWPWCSALCWCGSCLLGCSTLLRYLLDSGPFYPIFPAIKEKPRQRGRG